MGIKNTFLHPVRYFKSVFNRSKHVSQLSLKSPNESRKCQNGDTTPSGNSRHGSKKQAKKEVKEERRKVVEERLEYEKEERIQTTGRDWGTEAGPESTLLTPQYGFLPVMQSRMSGLRDYVEAKDLTTGNIGKRVVLRARLESTRKMSAKLAIFILRLQINTLTAVLHVTSGNSPLSETAESIEDNSTKESNTLSSNHQSPLTTSQPDSHNANISNTSHNNHTSTATEPPTTPKPGDQTEGVTESFVRWAEHLKRETLIEVHGVLKKPQNHEQYIKGTTIHDIELHIEKLFVIGRVTEEIPFHHREIGHSEGTEEQIQTQNTVSLRTELGNRVYDLRAPQNLAIFRIQSGVCQIFRNYLDGCGFIEIHTAKLQAAATEGGASVFKVDYFGRSAFLAQSPQLGKQMAIAADLGRVYEIGPVFRAEDSNTHRHMTEFIGLDLEMTITSHYHECMNLIDGVLKAIFKGIQQDYRKELEIIKSKYPHQDLVFPDKTVVLNYSEGVKLLREANHTHEDGSRIEDDEDFDTPTEKRLGALVKEKYHTDYYILDKFPLSVRPFYTMPHPDDVRWCNSFDIFLRGEEILSGGQRIHDSVMLEKRMRECGVDPETLEEYTRAFRWGAPPHAGGGIGLERLVMLILQLGDLRVASLYPRDPKSFPVNLNAKKGLRPKIGRNGTMPTLEELIAAYGDSTNTSYVDPRYTIWRHDKTGAAIGYILSNHHYAVIWGRPLCAPEDRSIVIDSWLQYCHEQSYKPIWCCLDSETEKILSEKYNWRSLSCVQEARIPLTNTNGEDSNVSRKIKQAKKAGVIVVEVDGEVPDEIKDEIDQHIQEWSSNRNGKQVHTTDIRPWDDLGHRRYFYAKDREGRIVGLTVLAQLAPEFGRQIKWNLEFTDAPSGTIELMTSTVMKASQEDGVEKLTFGASASEKLEGAHNLSKPTIRFLTHAYNGVTSAGNLMNKTDFRTKFGVEGDPLYIAYPPRGLGAHGIQAIMASIEDNQEDGKGK